MDFSKALKSTFGVGIFCILACIGCQPGPLSAGGETGESSTSESGGTESIETGEEGTETGEEACDEDFSWLGVRVNYPDLTSIAVAGEHFLAAGEQVIGRYDGDALDLIEGLDVFEYGWPQIAMRSLEDAWFANGGSIYHWDGAALDSTLSGLSRHLVRVAEDGEVYAMAEVSCNQFNCAPRFWQWSEGAWIELDNSELQRGRDMWPLAGGEMWAAGLNGGFAHRVDGAWTLETFPDESFEPWAITVDAEGHVYAAGDTLEGGLLIRREGEGVWSTHDLLPESGSIVGLVPEEDSVIVVQRPGRITLARWSGEAAPSVFWDADEAVDNGGETRTAAGTAEGIVVLGEGPVAYRVDPSAPDTSETLADLEAFSASRGASAGVDAMFESKGRSIYRFEGGAGEWAQVFRLDDFVEVEGGSISTMWAEGPEAAVFVVSSYDDDPPPELWRWHEGGVTPLAKPDADSFDQLWGTSLDNLWLLGTRALDAVLWRFDGEGWIELPDPGLAGPALTIGGDADALFVVASTGTVWRYDLAADEWSELGAPSLPEPPQSATIVRVGDELYVHLTWLEGWDFPDLVDQMFRLEDGVWWSAYAGLPTDRVFAMADQGNGRAWVITGDYADNYQLHMREAGAPVDEPWQAVDTGAPLVRPLYTDFTILASEDGALVHDEIHTALYARCPGD